MSDKKVCCFSSLHVSGAPATNRRFLINALLRVACAALRQEARHHVRNILEAAVCQPPPALVGSWKPAVVHQMLECIAHSLRWSECSGVGHWSLSLQEKEDILQSLCLRMHAANWAVDDWRFLLTKGTDALRKYFDLRFHMRYSFCLGACMCVRMSTVDKPVATVAQN